MGLRCPFHYRGLECKSRKSRNTYSSRQFWSWSTEGSRAKANRVLPRERTGHSKHPLPTTQEKTLHMDITRWSTPKSDWYILCSQRWRSSIQLVKTRLGADCGSDHELLIAKLRLKLKKVRKTTRTLSYKKESESEVDQLCLTLCDPMDCSPPCSSIHGIFRAGVLEWVAVSFSRGSFWPRDWIQVSHIAGRRFTVEPPDIKVWPKSNPLWLYSGGDE